MYIKEIQIDNFGPINHQQIHLCADGLNVISGYNAIGKTQLLASVYAIFFGNQILQYHSEAENEGRTYLQVCLGTEIVNLTQRHTNKSSRLLFKSFDNLYDALKIDREKLFFYFPDLERHDKPKYSKSDMQEGFRFLCDLGLQGHHILGTCIAKTEVDVLMSFSEQRYLDIICFLSKIPQDSILVADGLLSVMDYQMCNMVLDVLVRMKGIQFILAENKALEDIFLQRNINTILLDPPSKNVNPVSYNYKTIKRNHSFVNHTKNSGESMENTIVPVTYKLGDLFPYGENSEIELKEIKGNRACDAIVANAEIYINAYLNSFPKAIGKIFWGVNNDKIITGVKLSYQDIDTIQRKLSEILAQSEPFISPDLYNITFNHVASTDGKVQPEVYVVEVDVFPHRATRLYSTSKGQVYIKTPGGKKKLSNLQIQELILLRSKQSKNLIKI